MKKLQIDGQIVLTKHGVVVFSLSPYIDRNGEHSGNTTSGMKVRYKHKDVTVLADLYQHGDSYFAEISNIHSDEVSDKVRQIMDWLNLPVVRVSEEYSFSSKVKIVGGGRFKFQDFPELTDTEKLVIMQKEKEKFNPQS